MNKRFYLIFFFLLLSRYVVAQAPPASFTRTTDKETRLPIPGVAIKLREYTLTADRYIRAGFSASCHIKENEKWTGIVPIINYRIEI